MLDRRKESRKSQNCQVGKNSQVGWKRKQDCVKGNNDGCRKKWRERKVHGKVVMLKIRKAIDQSWECLLELQMSPQISHGQVENAQFTS